MKTTKQAALAGSTKSIDNPLLGNEKLRQLYAVMLRRRALEERTRLLLKQESLTRSPAAPAGQEAAMVGCTIDLRPEDAIAAPHRDLAAQFMRGLPLETIFEEILSRRNAGGGAAEPGARAPRRGSLSASATIALAGKLKETGNVVVAFCGRSPAVWREALRGSGAESLPIVFVFERRFPAGRSGQRRQRAQRAGQDRGFPAIPPAIPVDGGDVVAVYRVAHESILRARRGDGPTLIECKAVRRGERPAAGRAGGSDPIQYMEQYLMGKGLFEEAWKDQIIREFSRRMDTALHTVGRRYRSCAVGNAS